MDDHTSEQNPYSSVHLAQRFVGEALSRFFDARSLAELGAWFSIAIASIGSAILIALLVSSSDNWTTGPAENGLYELTEAAAIGCAGILLLVAALRFKAEIFYFSALASFLCGLAVVRETPRCGSAFYEGGICFSSNQKTIIVAVGAVLLLALLAVRRERFILPFKHLTFFYVVPASFTVVMVVSGSLFESHGYVWFEEIAEMAGYLNLFAFAAVLNLRPDWFAVSRSGDPTAAPSSSA